MIIEVLDNFCNILGEKVSKEKTRIYFSKNVEHALSKEVGELSGYFMVVLPIKPMKIFLIE